MSQCEQILRYLEDVGSITPMEAIEQFGCLRLAARIADLKKLGVKIRTTRAVGKNRYGEKVSYAIYFLEGGV